MIAITPPSDNTWVVIAATIVTSFVVAAALVPIVRWAAHRLSVLDSPEQGKMHSGATPYFGGIAIASVALIIPSLFSGWSQDAAFVGLGALMVSATGLVDDLRTLNPAPRLGIEIIASLMAVHGGAEVQLFHNWLDPVISVVWLVVITNSFNLMDNMDGVAASIAIATASAILISAALQEQWLVAALCSAIVGSCFGFLIYNWHPASIFMGDAGSLLLGFLLAVCALKLRWDTGFEDSVTAVLLIMFPAVFDTILVVVSRVRAGRSIMLGGTDHTTHRLHKLGVPIRGVALLMALTAILSSTLGILVGRGVIDKWVAIPPVLLVAGLTFVRMIKMPVYAEGAGRQAAPRKG